MSTIPLLLRRSLAGLALIAAVGGLAACGSSSSSSAGASGSSASSAGSSASRGAFRACLAQHGVTLPQRPAGSPPPGAGGAPGAGGGPGFFGGGAGAAARNPKLAAAIRACGGGRFAGRRRRLSRAGITKFVTCVRQHGFNLPAPNFSGRGGIFPQNLRSNPKFMAASRACQSLLVRPPAGSGAGSSASSGASS